MSAVLLLLALAMGHGSTCIIMSHTASCYHPGIVRIPQDLDDTITVLKLKENRITNINTGDLQRYTRLRNLIISNNHVRSLHEDAFLTLKELTDVDLSRNFITSISKYIFASNANLTRLTLSGNNLLLNNSYPFLISSSVQYLDLTSCGIRQISKVTFSMMAKLKELLLTNNNILRLHPDSLNHKSLENIHIDLTQKIIPTLSKLCRNMVNIYISLYVNYCIISKKVHRIHLLTRNIEQTDNGTANTTTSKHNMNIIEEKNNNETFAKTTSKDNKNIPDLIINQIVGTRTSNINQNTVPENTINETATAQSTNNETLWSKTSKDNKRNTLEMINKEFTDTRSTDDNKNKIPEKSTNAKVGITSSKANKNKIPVKGTNETIVITTLRGNKNIIPEMTNKEFINTTTTNIPEKSTIETFGTITSKDNKNNITEKTNNELVHNANGISLILLLTLYVIIVTASIGTICVLRCMNKNVSNYYIHTSVIRASPMEVHREEPQVLPSCVVPQRPGQILPYDELHHFMEVPAQRREPLVLSFNPSLRPLPTAPTLSNHVSYHDYEEVNF